MKTVLRLISCGLVLTTLNGCVTAETIRANAEANLAGYAAQIGGKPIGCTGSDTDGNNYVSCDLKDEQGNIIQVECAYDVTNSGCKSRPKTVVSPTQTQPQ